MNEKYMETRQNSVSLCCWKGLEIVMYTWLMRCPSPLKHVGFLQSFLSYGERMLKVSKGKSTKEMSLSVKALRAFLHICT